MITKITISYKGVEFETEYTVNEGFVELERIDHKGTSFYEVFTGHQIEDIERLIEKKIKDDY